MKVARSMDPHSFLPSLASSSVSGILTENVSCDLQVAIETLEASLNVD